MATHRKVLARALKDAEYSHKSISAAMGWKSPGTAGHKLIGRTDWSEGELVRMCKLVGMTFIDLAARSDDMPISNHHKTLEIASIVDKFSPEQREQILNLVKAFQRSLD